MQWFLLPWILFTTGCSILKDLFNRFFHCWCSENSHIPPTSLYASCMHHITSQTRVEHICVHENVCTHNSDHKQHSFLQCLLCLIFKVVLLLRIIQSAFLHSEYTMYFQQRSLVLLLTLFQATGKVLLFNITLNTVYGSILSF